VQYLAKTVAKGSILYTPFYADSGWEFLDKYFTHKRLISQKGTKYNYEKEKVLFQKESGFDKIWRSVRMLEQTWMKIHKNLRRYG
jgi:hypothetical protein